MQNQKAYIDWRALFIPWPLAVLGGAVLGMMMFTYFDKYDACSPSCIAPLCILLRRIFEVFPLLRWAARWQ